MAQQTKDNKTTPLEQDHIDSQGETQEKQKIIINLKDDVALQEAANAYMKALSEAGITSHNQPVIHTMPNGDTKEFVLKIRSSLLEETTPSSTSHPIKKKKDN